MTHEEIIELAMKAWSGISWNDKYHNESTYVKRTKELLEALQAIADNSTNAVAVMRAKDAISRVAANNQPTSPPTSGLLYDHKKPLSCSLASTPRN